MVTMTRICLAQSYRGPAVYLFIVAAMAASGRASAHVKWFTAYDLRSQPQPIAAIFTDTAFVQLLAAALMIMVLVGWADYRLSKQPSLTSTTQQQKWQPRLLRFGIALFFFDHGAAASQLHPDARTGVTRSRCH
jgi:hypothetical protein